MSVDLGSVGLLDNSDCKRAGSAGSDTPQLRVRSCAARPRAMIQCIQRSAEQKGNGKEVQGRAEGWGVGV